MRDYTSRRRRTSTGRREDGNRKLGTLSVMGRFEKG